MNINSNNSQQQQQLTMLALKQIPLITLPAHNKLHKNSHQETDKGLMGSNILAYKFRLSCQTHNSNAIAIPTRLQMHTLDKVNDLDALPHQGHSKQISIRNKIKRRISTAGTSKRFPKDFFRNDQKDCTVVKKQTLLQLNWHNVSNPHKLLAQNKKIYKQNSQIMQNPSLNTPKFHEPDPQCQSHNQFLVAEAPKQVTPFPTLQQLKIQAQGQIQTSMPIMAQSEKYRYSQKQKQIQKQQAMDNDKIKTTRPNFIKKVKKGQFLKQKFQSKSTSYQTYTKKQKQRIKQSQQQKQNEQ